MPSTISDIHRTISSVQRRVEEIHQTLQDREEDDSRNRAAIRQTRTPTTTMSTRHAPKRSAPSSTEPVDTKSSKSEQQGYIATTLQVTRAISGGTDKCTFTLDLPLDTPFDELDTLVKPIIDPNSAAGATRLLSVAVGQSLTFAQRTATSCPAVPLRLS